MEIRADGTLDFPDEVLAQLDFVAASLHTGLSQSREQVMERALVALENPHVDMLAHPTGRLIPDRPGADLDMETLLKVARRNRHHHGNQCQPAPARPARHPRAARGGARGEDGYQHRCPSRRGARPDALTAWRRRSEVGLSAADIVNTWPLDRQLLDYLAGKRAG
jgi:hypothetical protein